MRTGGWRYWFVGLVLGVLLGFLVFLLGVFVLLGVTAFAVLAVIGRSVPFVSGGLVGLGGLWLLLMARVVLTCQPYPEAGQSCDVSYGTYQFIWISLGILVVGIATGIAGWWMGRRSSEG
jgi:hypothetical protein